MFSRIVFSFLLILLTAQLSFGGEKEDFSLAKGAYSDKLFEIAGKQFAGFLLKYPGSKKTPLVHFHLAECEFRQGHFEKAKAEYELASRDKETKEKSTCMAGKCLFAGKQFDKAAVSLTLFLKDYPETKLAPDASYWLAEAFFNKKEFKKASEIYLQIPKKYPGCPYAEYALLSSGICFYKLNKLKEAMSSFSSMIAEFPESKLIPGAEFRLGQTYVKAGELKKAQNVFRKIIKNYPRSEYNDGVQYSIGFVSLRLGNYEEAIKSFNQLKSTFPESQYVDESCYNIAKSYNEMQKGEEAVAAYKEFIKKFPSSKLIPSALYNLAECYTYLDDWEEAGLSYQKLLSDYPEDPLAEKSQFRICFHYYSTGSYEKAELACCEFLKKFPSTGMSSAALFCLGNVCYSQGKPDGAIQAYKKLKDGNFQKEWREKGYFYLGAVLLKEGKYEEAINEFKSFEREFPKSSLMPEAVSCIGQCYFLKGEYNSARTCFEKAASLSPGLRDLLYLKAGDCFLNEGLIEKAITSYNRVEGEISDLAKFRTGRALCCQNKFDRAILIFQSLAGGKNYLADDALCRLAGCLLKTGKMEDAEKNYMNFIEQYPESELLPGVFFNLGNIQYRKKSFKNALEIYIKVCKMFPQTEEASECRFWMGLCQFELGSRERGKKLLEEYISASPEGKWKQQAQFQMAKYFFEKKEFDKAKKTLLSLIEHPDNAVRADAHYLLGCCLQAGEEYKLAITEFDKISKIYPHGRRAIEAWFKIANLLNLENNHEEALNVYKKIAKEDSENDFLCDNLYFMGKTLRKLGKYSEAIRTFRQIQNTEDEEISAEIQFGIAGCFQELGEMEEAILEYLKAAYLYPDNLNWAVRAQECAARCLEKQGRIDDAGKLYMRIMERDPYGVKGELARQKLKEIKQQIH